MQVQLEARIWDPYRSSAFRSFTSQENLTFLDIFRDSQATREAHTTNLANQELQASSWLASREAEAKEAMLEIVKIRRLNISREYLGN